MPRGRDNKRELRCFCSRKPLLAMYGVDRKSRVYVHCRVYKQNRIFGEWIAYDGEVKIRCRECLRWHKITFVSRDRPQAILNETQTPVEVDANVSLGVMPKRLEGGEHDRNG